MNNPHEDDIWLATVIDAYRSHHPVNPGQLEGLRRRVMGLVSAETMRGECAALLTPHGRRYAITLGSLRSEVRQTVDGEPGVQARDIRIMGTHSPTATLDVRVGLAVSVGTSIPEKQHLLRTRIARSLNETVGVRIGSIDLIAEDIYDEWSFSNTSRKTRIADHRKDWDSSRSCPSGAQLQGSSHRHD